MTTRSFIAAIRGGVPIPPVVGLLAGLVVLAALVAIDIVLDEQSAAIVGTYLAAPFLVALISGPRTTLAIGAIATLAAAGGPFWNMGTEGADQAVRVGVIGVSSLFAAGSAWIRTRARGRADRLRLLNEVGAVADGSLPLAETLNRVVDVVVPAVGDICAIDAVHDGRVTRLAVRASGRPDAAEIEQRFRRRKPGLPAWLVSGDRPWRKLPRWVPKLGDEELRRMAESPDDLEFLRSLELCSTIVAPVMARDRNLGALTLITGWSERRYTADDLRFAQILAGRIGLALDNAGLFSDLESIERRMDSVMSILDEAVVIHGADGELVFANPAAARTLGFETSEQAVATPMAAIRERFSIRDEAGRELGAEALAGQRVLRGVDAQPLTLRVTELASGDERWMRTKSQAIAGPGGELLYSVTAIEDVTDVKRAEFGQRLLARTGELLEHSEEHSRMLEKIPRLVVPEFADWCVVNVPGSSGAMRMVATAHRDPERERLVRELGRHYPARLDDRGGSAEAVRTGEPQIVAAADEQALGPIARDDRHLALLAGLEFGEAMVVPMSVGGRVLGTLLFCNERGSRRFDHEDLELAQQIGLRCAVAIESARVAEERARVADALQRELLPPSLPQMPGWELATMYEPAGELNEVGGDFYEVFPVERGWAVVLGDVSGRGAAAASLTAEARHTIRTAGALSGDACAGLRLLDANLRGRDDAALCSVAIVVLPREAGEGEVEVYLAGHPHPLFLATGEAHEIGDPGPLLGVVEDAQWRPHRVAVRPGDQLVLYTDGVIEARAADGERYGTERLRRGLAGCTTPASAVKRVREGLDRFGAEARQDDAAVVAIRCAGYGEPLALGTRTASSTSAAS